MMTQKTSTSIATAAPVVGAVAVLALTAFAPLVSANIDQEWTYDLGQGNPRKCSGLDTVDGSHGEYAYGFKMGYGSRPGCEDTNGFVPLESHFFKKEILATCNTLDLSKIEVMVTCTNEDWWGDYLFADVAFRGVDGADISHIEIDLGLKTWGGKDKGVLYDVSSIGATGLSPVGTNCVIDGSGTDACKGILHINFCLECPASPPPPGPPGMTGDPHIRTWSGDWYEYHGECDLKLAHAPQFDEAGQDIDIDVRTTIRSDWSYIEAVAIKIGDDVLEVDSYGDYVLNGVEDALEDDSQDMSLLRKTQTITTLGGYPVHHTILRKDKNKHEFDVVLSPTENITLSTFKFMVNINFVGPVTKDRFKHVEGILGNYQGKLMARDGVTDMSQEDLNHFGQEWQITDEEPMLFRFARSPQYPEPCTLPPPVDYSAQKQRRLSEGGVTEDTAQMACSRFAKNKPAFEACVYDVTAMNDLSVADSGAY